MCWSIGKGENDAMNIFRPHRFLGIRSPIDAMVHPGDEYNQPKQAAVDPVIERQAYVSPIPRTSSSVTNRRRLAGVNTSSQGVSGGASTTGGVIPVGGG